MRASARAVVVLTVALLVGAIVWYALRGAGPVSSVDIERAEEEGQVAPPVLVGRPPEEPSEAPHTSPQHGEEPVVRSDPTPVAPPEPKATRVHVRVGDDAPRTGRVVVRRFTGGRGELPAEYVLGPDGIVEITTERDVFLVVHTDERQPRVVVLDHDDAGDILDVVFGTGEVYGTVRGERGFPAEGVTVRISSHLERNEEGRYRPSAEGARFSMSTVSDRDGHYVLADLPTGTMVVATVRPQDDPLADRNMRTVKVMLGPGERRRVDFGTEDAEARWTGVLRYRDGVAVRRPVNIFMTRTEGGGRLYARSDEEGRITETIPAGTYGVEMVVPRSGEIFGGMRLVPSATRITLDAGEVVRDLTYPGARIEGRIPEFVGDGRQHVRATLVEPDGEVPVSTINGQPVRSQSGVIGADGSFVVDGLSPGLWRLSGSPLALGVTEVHVDAHRALVTVELSAERNRKGATSREERDG